MQQKWHVLHQVLDALYRKQGVLQWTMGTSFQGMGFFQLYCLTLLSCCFKDFLEIVEVLRLPRLSGRANLTLVPALLFLNLHAYIISMLSS